MDTQTARQAVTRESEAPAPAQPRYLNRELSWLEFNGRVLALAEDSDTPLLERVKFLAIFNSNLDEFFQVRVAGLKDQLAAGLSTSGLDGASPVQQLRAVTELANQLVVRQSQLFAHTLAPALAEADIRLVSWLKLGADDRAYLDTVFEG
ncbi:MAG: RNA degradosome polyphosphate kinase, partial [Actinomycetota bacterium]|nr:RNA degradosome polyphosphate kinase [Actinomycetota bacterium]